MSPAGRCDRILDLIDRVLAEAATVVRRAPTPVPLPVRVRPPRAP